MTSRIPPELARRSPGNNDATSAKIVAAGVSVAAGIGLVGAMAATQTPTAVTVQAPTQRIIVIEQPAQAQLVPPLPASVAEAPLVPASKAPTAVIIETQPVPEPVTVSEGS